MTPDRSPTSVTWLACLAALAACSDNAPAAQSSSASTLYANLQAEDASVPGESHAEQPLDGVLPAPVMKALSTERIGQLTDVPQNDIRRLGMSGTDLGISFRRADKLHFLFGDSLLPGWKTNLLVALSPDMNLDSVASSSLVRQRDEIPKLDWAKRSNGKFQPFVLKSPDPKKPIPALKEMSVPVEGINLDNDVTYLFFHVVPNGGDLATRVQQASSVIAHTTQTGDDFVNLQVDQVRQNSKFRSLSIVRTGGSIWIFGTEVYRNSPVYLALATPETLGNRDLWKFYKSLDLSDGHMVEAENEASAGVLVNERCVGELSVRKHPTRDLFFMTYNCTAEDGTQSILLRTANHPAGPWSEAVPIFRAPEADFLVHRTDPEGGPDDQRGTDGDLYGPYMVPEWFNDTTDGKIEIVYTLSSWLPYQVHLMRTQLEPVN